MSVDTPTSQSASPARSRRRKNSGISVNYTLELVVMEAFSSLLRPFRYSESRFVEQLTDHPETTAHGQLPT
jgi:hypothetical protein